MVILPLFRKGAIVFQKITEIKYYRNLSTFLLSLNNLKMISEMVPYGISHALI